MHSSVEDMLPPGWKLAESQSLIGLQASVVTQKEKTHFVRVFTNVYSKEFASKSRAMKMLSRIDAPVRPHSPLSLLFNLPGLTI